MCTLPANSSETNLDVSLMSVLSCHVADAKGLAECAARKYALEEAIRVCAGSR